MISIRSMSKKHGLNKRSMKITPDAVEEIIDYYLRQRRDDASRHGADIGFPVPADVGLIPHAGRRC